MTTQPLSRRGVTRTFKMRGLTLQAPALEALMSVLERESEQQDVVLKALLDATRERLASNGRIVTKELLADIVSELSKDASDILDEALELLDAFDTPRLAFDPMRKQFRLIKLEERSLFGEAKHKVAMFAQRYALIQQRTLRQDLFRPQLVSANGRQASSDGRNVTHSITPVESLLGRTGVKFLLGMIVQVSARSTEVDSGLPLSCGCNLGRRRSLLS